MLNITDPRIDSYLMKLVPEVPAAIRAMEQRAEQEDFPIIGRLCGRLLHLVTRLKEPRLVVELGSGFGYSAYWFATAMTRGKVVLIDYSQENLDYARRAFSDFGILDRSEFRVGDALEIGAGYEGIDLLFLDLEKHQYPDALQLMLPRLAPRALVIADNTLWHGQVAEEDVSDPDAESIRRFNDLLFSNEDFFTSIIPLRDGILLAQKLT